MGAMECLRIFCHTNGMTLMQLVHQHRAAIMRIGKQYGAENIRLFGSAIRGEDTNMSDIDFLITLKSGYTYFDLVRMKRDLESELKRPVDIVLDTAVKPMLKEEIFRTAVTV